MDKRDEKLHKFILSTLNEGPSSSDEAETETSNDHQNKKCQKKKVKTKFQKQVLTRSQSYSSASDVTNLTLGEESVLETVHFYTVKEDEFERECIAAHVQRLKKEKKRILEQTDKAVKVFTGKDVKNTRGKKKRSKNQ